MDAIFSVSALHASISDGCFHIIPEQSIKADFAAGGLCPSKQWYKRKIVSQNSTGSVRIVDKDGEDPMIVDLSEREWSWTSFPVDSIPAVRGPTGAGGDLIQQ